MNKPSTILQREFKDKIVAAINESQLPAFVLTPVLQQALTELERLDEQQYKADLAAYEEDEENGEVIETE